MREKMLFMAWGVGAYRSPEADTSGTRGEVRAERERERVCEWIRRGPGGREGESGSTGVYA